jgi:hypothetical protein
MHPDNATRDLNVMEWALFPVARDGLPAPSVPCS